MTELSFPALLAALAPDVPEPVAEFRFSQRRYRFDFCWPEKRVFVELDGGQWAPHGGRHAGDADRDKMNLAASLGWRGLHFSPAQLREDPGHCVALVRLMLG